MARSISHAFILVCVCVCMHLEKSTETVVLCVMTDIGREKASANSFPKYPLIRQRLPSE